MYNLFRLRVSFNWAFFVIFFPDSFQYQFHQQHFEPCNKFEEMNFAGLELSPKTSWSLDREKRAFLWKNSWGLMILHFPRFFHKIFWYLFADKTLPWCSFIWIKEFYFIIYRKLSVVCLLHGLGYCNTCLTSKGVEFHQEFNVSIHIST